MPRSSRRSCARLPRERRCPSRRRSYSPCGSPPAPWKLVGPDSYIKLAFMSDTLMVSVSGVRGLVGLDLTPEVVARWAAAFGTWAKNGKRNRIVVGRDARTSGPMFAGAAIAGLNSVGCHVIDVGLVATPTVQLAVEHHRAAGGIILTASHNPIEWNAVKFVGPDGIFLDGVAGTRVRELAAGDSLPRAKYNAIGGVEAEAGPVCPPPAPPP